MKLFGWQISRVKKSQPLKTEVQRRTDNRLRIGVGSVTKQAKFDIRSSKEGTAISIGCDSLINGTYVIENDNGSIQIGDRSFIGNSLFVSAEGIEIGSDVMISWGCTFIDNDAHSLNWVDRCNDVRDWKIGVENSELGALKNWSVVNRAKIRIQDNAWVGFNAIILKGVTIGKGAVVAAGSVVTKDVAPFTLVAGNPAKFVKNLQENL